MSTQFVQLGIPRNPEFVPVAVSWEQGTAPAGNRLDIFGVGTDTGLYMARPRNTVVSISDIHIGNNTTTCWYNKDFHEPYLNSILEYVISKKDDIKELIILGDLFDLWAYPPDTEPPSVEDIIGANLKILGEGGMLDKVVTALEGRVSYLNGNHDITVTQQDLDKITKSNANGYKITKRDDTYTVGRCFFTHGHLFTIFNAPDPVNRVPIGYFVTRLISYYVQQTAWKDGPAWTRPGYGAPGLMRIIFSTAFGPALKFYDELYRKKEFGPSIVKAFIDMWVNVTDFANSKSGVFVMRNPYPTGPTFLTIDQVLNAYANKEYPNGTTNLFSYWVKNHGVEYVQNSVWTDGTARNMSWFTQQQALSPSYLQNQWEYSSIGLTVTGHTHWPTSGVAALVNDVNGGFECFPKPGVVTTGQKDRYTFVEVKNVDSSPTPTIYEITRSLLGAYECKAASYLPKGEMVHGTYDASVYVIVINNSNDAVRLPPTYIPRIISGKWVIEPAKEILHPGGRSGFWLQNKPEAGAEGSVEYEIKRLGGSDTSNITLGFGCPYGGGNPRIQNYVSVTGSGSSRVSYMSKVSDQPLKINEVSTHGNPLSIYFIIHNSPPT